MAAPEENWLVDSVLARLEVALQEPEPMETCDEETAPSFSPCMSGTESSTELESGEIDESAERRFVTEREQSNLPRAEQECVPRLSVAQTRYQIPVYDGASAAVRAAPTSAPISAGNVGNIPNAPRANLKPNHGQPPAIQSSVAVTTLLSKACQLKGFNPVWEWVTRGGQRSLCLCLPNDEVLEASHKLEERPAKAALAEKGLEKLRDNFGAGLITRAQDFILRESRGLKDQTNQPQQDRREWLLAHQMTTQGRDITQARGPGIFAASTGRMMASSAKSYNGATGTSGVLVVTRAEKADEILRRVEEHVGTKALGSNLETRAARDAFLEGMAVGRRLQNESHKGNTPSATRNTPSGSRSAPSATRARSRSRSPQATFRYRDRSPHRGELYSGSASQNLRGDQYSGPAYKQQGQADRYTTPSSRRTRDTRGSSPKIKRESPDPAARSDKTTTDSGAANERLQSLQTARGRSNFALTNERWDHSGYYSRYPRN
ncbi:hypothetical protein OQA88_3526 [Cercophora sp. LCS_1]